MHRAPLALARSGLRASWAPPATRMLLAGPPPAVRSALALSSRARGPAATPGNVFHLQRRHQFYRAGDWTRTKKLRGVRPEAVIASLIAANVVVTMFWYRARRSPYGQRFMLTKFTTSPQHLETGRYYTLLTSTFSHADVGHLATNMIGLYFFGHQICEVLGNKRFLGLYLASGVLSSLGAVLEQKREGRSSFNLGASGAVNSITAMSVLLFPRSTLLIFGIVPLPAWVAGSLFISRDAYSWLTDRRDGIGHFAHLSGAFCGGLYFAYLRRSGALRRFH